MRFSRVMVVLALMGPVAQASVRFADGGSPTAVGPDGAVWLVVSGASVDDPDWSARVDFRTAERTEGRYADALGAGREWGFSQALPDQSLALAWTLREMPRGALAARLSVRNTGSRPRILSHLTVLSGERPGAPANGRVLVNGWHSWDSCRTQVVVPGSTLDSWYVTAASSPPITVGFITAMHNFGHVRLRAGECSLAVEVVADCDGCELPSGVERVSDWAWATPEPDTLAALEHYGRLYGELGRGRVWEPNFATWCSWYGGIIRDTPGLEAFMRRNAPIIARECAPLGAGWMRIVDDSTAYPYGDWPDRSWGVPGGARELARDLKTQGIHPGFWLPPFACAAKGTTVRRHPGWFQQTADGQPLASDFYGNMCEYLDASDPGARAYLEETARRLAARGMDYVMTDFLLLSVAGARFHDPTLTRAEVCRMGLEAFRRGLGDNVYWLACGAPLGPSVGLVDGMRIGPDSFGDNVQAYVNGACRFFYHRNAWLNDPDAIVLRGRSREWSRAWESWIALSGGVVTYGDDMATLAPDRFEDLTRTWPPMDVAGKPLDLMDRERPLVWATPVSAAGEKWWLAGIFYFADTAYQSLALNLDRVTGTGGPSTRARYLVWDFWNERFLGECDGKLGLPLPSAGCRVLGVRKATGHPQLLATLRHIGMGVHEVKASSWERDSGLLRLTTEGTGGIPTRAAFYVPEGWQVTAVRCGGRVLDWSTPQDRVIVVEIPDSRGRATVGLHFRRSGALPEMPPRPVARRGVAELVFDRAAFQARLEAISDGTDPTYGARAKQVVPLGWSLVGYADCGASWDPEWLPEIGLGWVRGSAFTWEGGGGPTEARTCRFDNERVVYKVSGLTPGRRYRLGLLMWDTDGRSRVQRVVFESPSGLRTEAIAAHQLPSGPKGEGPELRWCDIPVVLSDGRDFTVAVELVSGINAVVSEVWVVGRMQQR